MSRRPDAALLERPGPGRSDGTARAAGQKGEQGPPGSSPASPDAIAGTLSVHRVQQGSFGAGLQIIGLSHQIVSPRDAASGQATGKRQHKPFTITKEIDKSSPLFLRSIFTNETLTSVLIGLLLPNGETMATVELENAHVSGRLQHGTPRRSRSSPEDHVDLDGRRHHREDDWRCRTQLDASLLGE